ncbi:MULTISPECIES: DUF6602 domain-containing protein [Bacillaceae]|uniref:DUF6602 domain-containing protein n=1 Tax=Evansella alkalicola TaxID=745819 RepID=A0ABS6JST6_9BACI|nr:MULTISPECIES: DUF6602 domain-containing protein [Bacillaceae]MBU9721626.1 hypothetical protein [Bacillus alkalicola]
MANSQFQYYIDEHAQNFKRAFESSKSLFKKHPDAMSFHNHEFGTYREELVRQYLRSFIPEFLDLSHGFIITPSDNNSPQCDVVVYDKGNSTLIQAGGLQRFFTVESAAAIGEVKSDLALGAEKNSLKSSLLKLANKVKSLREDVNLNSVVILKGNSHRKQTDFFYNRLLENAAVLKKLIGSLDEEKQENFKDILKEVDEKIKLFSKNTEEIKIELELEQDVEVKLERAIKDFNTMYKSYVAMRYNPQSYHFDHLATFLVCNKLNFGDTDEKNEKNKNSLIENIKNWYGTTEQYNWNNMVLSIEDGIILYRSKKGEFCPYPVWWGENTEMVFVPANEGNDHIKLFFYFMYQISSNATILCPEINEYITIPDMKYI